MKAKYIIGALVIIVLIVWGTTAFLKTSIQYVDISEARESQRTVQVLGKVDFNQAGFSEEESRFEFVIYDPEAPDPIGAEQLKVVYYGVVPGNFEQATSVVVKGRAGGDVFVADQLLVKCPSKYQGEGSDEYEDVEKHQAGDPPAGA